MMDGHFAERDTLSAEAVFYDPCLSAYWTLDIGRCLSCTGYPFKGAMVQKLRKFVWRMTVYWPRRLVWFFILWWFWVHEDDTRVTLKEAWRWSRLWFAFPFDYQG